MFEVFISFEILIVIRLFLISDANVRLLFEIRKKNQRKVQEKSKIVGKIGISLRNDAFWWQNSW